MGGVASSAIGRLVRSNSARMARRAADVGEPNPRAIDDVPWARDLASQHGAIRAEWDRFEAGGGLLPTIGHLIDEDQGEDGVWRAGLLVSRGRPAGPLPARFPATVEALRGVPSLWSALFSVLEPGAVLPEHRGFNGGMLRYHLGICCTGDTALALPCQVIPYREGVGVLFDDTDPHSAWNRSDRTRVTLFCELLRPAGPALGLANRAVQEAIALDPRYRQAPARAARWEAAFGV